LESIYNEVKAVGGEIFLIGPETDELAMQLLEKTKATIPNLYDEDGSVINSYKLAFELPEFFQGAYKQMGLDLPTSNPATGWMLPIPATLIVGKDSKISARYVNADHTRRMEPADVLAAVQEAAKS
jgi:peroxiredoxin